MTDEQIIKGLEICIAGDRCDECPINPGVGNYGYCTNLAIMHALNLVTSQKAEIERLSNLLRKADGYIVNARADAIKDFAEKVKKYKIKPEFPWDEFYIYESVIDDLVKEMTEGEKI